MFILIGHLEQMENTTRLELWLVPLMIFITSKNFAELCHTVIIDIIAVFFYAYYINSGGVKSVETWLLL